MGVACDRGAEALSVERAFAAIKRADIVVMVVDAGQGITEQDFKLSEFASQQVTRASPPSPPFDLQCNICT
jgi:predicted GTPase